MRNILRWGGRSLGSSGSGPKSGARVVRQFVPNMALWNCLGVSDPKSAHWRGMFNSSVNACRSTGLELSGGTRSQNPAGHRPRGRVPTYVTKRMDMFPQQGYVVESARRVDKQSASLASVGIPGPRLKRRIQTLGPKGAPGCQSPDDTQDSRLVAEYRGGFPALREANSTRGRSALEESRSPSMGPCHRRHLVALGRSPGTLGRSRAEQMGMSRRWMARCVVVEDDQRSSAHSVRWRRRWDNALQRRSHIELEQPWQITEIRPRDLGTPRGNNMLASSMPQNRTPQTIPRQRHMMDDDQCIVLLSRTSKTMS